MQLLRNFIVLFVRFQCFVCVVTRTT